MSGEGNSFTSFRLIGFIVLLACIANGFFIKYPNAAFRTDRAINGCPIEYSNDTSSLTSPQGGDYFAIGQLVESRCDAGYANWKLELKEKPESFTIFPSASRTCLANGVWSSPSPVCLWKIANKHGNLNIEPSHAENLKSDALNEEGWISIGKNLNCRHEEHQHDTSATSPIQTYQLEYRFKVPHYFSFVELSADTEVTNVEVYAHEGRLIAKELSNEARDFQQKHHKEWRGIHLPTDNSILCYFTELSVYTDMLRVRHSIKQHQSLGEKQEKQVNVVFYAFKSQASTESCPILPSIPNTRLLKTEKRNVYEYSCSAGYLLIDLETHKPASNGKLRCIAGKWTPYPFLACLNFTELTYDSNSEIRSEQGWTTSSAILIVGIVLFIGAIILTGLAFRFPERLEQLSSWVRRPNSAGLPSVTQNGEMASTSDESESDRVNEDDEES